MLNPILEAIPPLVWFLIFFGAGWLAIGVFLALGFHEFIALREASAEADRASGVLTEPESPSDLDDWLAGTSLDLDFKVCQLPKAETQLDRRAA